MLGYSIPQTVLTGLWFTLNGIVSVPFSMAVLPVPPQGIAATPQIQCPSEVFPLIDRLLQDLPSYLNRVRTRAGIRKSFIMLAARPEFEPLPLSIVPETATGKTQQVFFTTLQRRYERDRMLYLQEYHWLFLTQTPKDWQFVMLYSTFGPYPAKRDQPPLPPRNSSEGSTAVAIREWLNNCRTGQLPMQPAPKASQKLLQTPRLP